jgi:CheY-like chemotaxis protein
VSEAQLLEAILRSLGNSADHKSELITRHTLHQTHKSLRVLVVDDIPVNRLLAMRLLEKQGHSVISAISGREAMEAIETQTFDLILMDVQMPDMNGFEATQAIREGERGTGNRVPIIALTAHAMEGDRNRCLTAGMDGYVSKPITAQALLAAIDNALSTSKDSVSSAVSAEP